LIILTGGCGFIGSNLLKALNALGESDILIVDNLSNATKYQNIVGAQFCDYMDKRDFRAALETKLIGVEIDSVFHLGACCDTLERDGEYVVRNNYEFSKILLHFALDQRAPFIYASSAAVYGSNMESNEDASQFAPLNVYGFSKLLFDRYVSRLLPSVRSTLVGLRYFNVYGNGEAHKGKMASMVYHLYNELVLSGTATLFGEHGGYKAGEQRRDFVSVSDVVSLNLFFWKSSPMQGIFNAGTGVSRSWNELASLVIREVGSGQIQYVDLPSELRGKYQLHTCANMDKVRTVGYDRTFLTLEEGVKDYVAALKSQRSCAGGAHQVT